MSKKDQWIIDALKVITNAFDLMTPEQKLKWEGYRALIEAKPEDLHNETINAFQEELSFYKDLIENCKESDDVYNLLYVKNREEMGEFLEREKKAKGEG